MSHRSVRLRLLALCVALVQLFGPAAATLADVQVELAALGPQSASHIESHRRPECAHVHSDDCALCQYLSTGANEPAAPTLPVAVAAIGGPGADRLLGRANARCRLVRRSRAPPVVAAPEA